MLVLGPHLRPHAMSTTITAPRTLRRRAVTPRPVTTVQHRRLTIALRAATDLGALAAGTAVLTGAGAATVLLPALAVTLLALRGSYRPQLVPKPIEDGPTLLGCVAIAFLVLSGLGVVAPGEDLPAVWASAGLAGLAGRVLFAGSRRGWSRRRGVPVLVVGRGLLGERLATRLLEHPGDGLRPVGFLDDRVDSPHREGAGIPWLGGLDEVVEAAEASGARRVLIAFHGGSDADLLPLVERCATAGLDVAVVPRLFDAMGGRSGVAFAGGVPLVDLAPADPRALRFAVKHVFDRSLAGFAVLAISPVLLAIAAAIKLSSPGPILYRQRRVGRDGQAFDVLKFRSMRGDGPAPAGFRPASGAAPGGVEGVDRRTAVGKLLRRTSLDELPQLLNVLRGDMSLVGPRPERPEFVELFAHQREIDRYDERHRVKCGITGWAQVHGLRGQTSIEKRIEWDNFYIQNHSLWLDVKTLALTARAVLKAAE